MDAVTGKDVRSFVMGHYMFWTGCTLVPLVLAAGMRSHYHILGSVFLLSCTVKGYLYGVLLPRAVKAFVHPLLVCTLYGVGCCALWGFFTGTAFADVLGAYLATVRPPHPPISFVVICCALAVASVAACSSDVACGLLEREHTCALQANPHARFA